MAYETRLGCVDDIEFIIQLSARVQASLTASGSLQQLSTLSNFELMTAVNARHCFVIQDELKTLIGCALVKRIREDYFQPTAAFAITAFSEPWQYMYSVMLEPTWQGRGIGEKLFRDIVRYLEPSGGTVLLDCWAGNSKLKNFYDRCGCQYVADVPENDYMIAVFFKPLSHDEYAAMPNPGDQYQGGIDV